MESESYDKASTKEKNIFGERFFKFYLNADTKKSELFLDNKHVSPKPFVINLWKTMAQAGAQVTC